MDLLESFFVAASAAQSCLAYKLDIISSAIRIVVLALSLV